MEIERKFLIHKLPEDLESYEHHMISQGYISTCPVIRIRQLDDSYILTMKSSGLLTREEYEMQITAEEFDNLSKKVEGNVISKTRYYIPIENGLKIELDVFHGAFEGLCYAEVEFPDEESAASFVAPDYFGTDVTEKSGYQNSALSSMSESEISSFMNSYRDQYKA